MTINKWLWKGQIGIYTHTKVTKLGSKIFIKASNDVQGKYLNVSYNTRYKTISVNKTNLYDEDNYYDSSSFNMLDINDRNVILTAIEKLNATI